MVSIPKILGRLLVVAGVSSLFTGCSSNAPLATVPQVDIERFMGDWYVIAIIPNRIEKDAYGSIESYELRPDGKIDITFTFREGGWDAPVKTLDMVGWVKDEATKAEWRVRPFWPLALEYFVTDLADDYRYTVIGHPSRNYVWIMAREKTLAEADWNAIVGRLEDQGFDPDRLIKIPQVPPS